MILPLYASLEKLDRGLLEAAGDLGATPWRAFWRVTVPLTMPGIIAGVVLVFIPSVGQFVVSDLLGGERSWLAGNLIQFQFTDTSGSKPLGAAVSFIVMGAVLLLLLIYAIYRAIALREWSGQAMSLSYRTPSTAVDRQTNPALRGYTYLVYAFLYLPIAALVAFSFNAGKSQAVWQGFSFHWYATRDTERPHPRLRQEQRHRRHRHLDRRHRHRRPRRPRAGQAFPGRGATAGLVLLPIVIPEIVLGVSLLTFFVPVMGWQPSPGTLMIAHVVFSLSYVAVVVRARLAGFDRTLEEAARDLGAGPLGVFCASRIPPDPPRRRRRALLAFHRLRRRLCHHVAGLPTGMANASPRTSTPR